MDRTTGADWVDIGGGRRGYRSQNLAAGLVGTEVTGLDMNSLQEEIMAVIEDPTLDPPIVPDPSNWTQLREAIRRMIDEVRVDMPVYPEVQTVDGKFTVTSPAAGTIRVGAGTEWIMRGGRRYETVQTDLVTAPSKIYHLRWRLDTGWVLYDLASLTYNPTALAETNTAFDTGYDDVLVARITTNAGNVATITRLVNRAFLATEHRVAMALPSALNFVTLPGSGATLDWARKPKFGQPIWQGFRSFNAEPSGVTHAAGAGTLRACEIKLAENGISRYGATDVQYWYEDDIPNEGFLIFVWTFWA